MTEIDEKVKEKLSTVAGGYVLFFDMLNRGGDWSSKVCVKKILEEKGFSDARILEVLKFCGESKPFQITKYVEGRGNVTFPLLRVDSWNKNKLHTEAKINKQDPFYYNEIVKLTVTKEDISCLVAQMDFKTFARRHARTTDNTIDAWLSRLSESAKKVLDEAEKQRQKLITAPTTQPSTTTQTTYTPPEYTQNKRTIKPKDHLTCY